jgi:hypothetical protein
MKSPRTMPGTGTGVPVPVLGILLGEEKAEIRLPIVSHSIISQQKGIHLPCDTVISQQKGVSAAALLKT